MAADQLLEGHLRDCLSSHTNLMSSRLVRYQKTVSLAGALAAACCQLFWWGGGGQTDHCLSVSP